MMLLGIFGMAICEAQAQQTEQTPAPSAEVSRAASQAAEPKSASAPSDATIPNQMELDKRVTARWDALVAGNFESAYAFETPSYRAINTFEQFKRRFGNRVTWYGGRAVKFTDKGNGVAEVMVKVRFKAAVPIPGADFGIEESPHKEKWVQEEGTWFHVTE